MPPPSASSFTRARHFTSPLSLPLSLVLASNRHLASSEEVGVGEGDGLGDTDGPGTEPTALADPVRHSNAAPPRIIERNMDFPLSGI
jgi:hypothetical protein